MTVGVACRRCRAVVSPLLIDDGTGRVLCPQCGHVFENYLAIDHGAKRTTISKLTAQLEAAHEAIDELRGEKFELERANLLLGLAVRDVLRFHDDCVCRHARRMLNGAIGIRTDRSGRPTP